MVKYRFSIEFESESSSVNLVMDLMNPIIVGTLKELCGENISQKLEVLEDLETNDDMKGWRS